MKMTCASTTTWPLQWQSQVYSGSFASKCEDQQCRQYHKKPQQPAISHQGSASSGFPADSLCWQLMGPLHSCTNSQLFPYGHQSATETMPEESVLMWTQLHPTLDMPWWHTYAWNGQLDGLAQAIDDSNLQSAHWQFSNFFEGATISKAMWNSAHDHQLVPKLQYTQLPQISQQSHASHLHPPLVKPPVASHMEKSNPQQQTGNRFKVKKYTPKSPGNNQDTSCMTAAQLIPHTLQTTHPVEFDAASEDSFAGTLADILQFLDQNIGGSGFKISSPCTGSQIWHHWNPPQKAAMPPTWCQRWVAAILQQFWDTSWDILTHRNVEKSAAWAWPAHITTLVLV